MTAIRVALLKENSSQSLFRLKQSRLNKAIFPKKKTSVNGIIHIIGDSLSDQGNKNGKYKKKILGFIPYSWFLSASPKDQFTNGDVWVYPMQLKMQYLLEERSVFNPLYNIHAYSIDANTIGINMAEGGSTAYNYGGILNLFEHIKGFFLSFFLNNIEKQSREIKKKARALDRMISFLFLQVQMILQRWGILEKKLLCGQLRELKSQ